MNKTGLDLFRMAAMAYLCRGVNNTYKINEHLQTFLKKPNIREGRVNKRERELGEKSEST